MRHADRGPVRPLLWVGDACIQKIQQHIQGRITQLLEGWGLQVRAEGRTQSLGASELQSLLSPAPLRWLGCPSQPGVWLAIPEPAAMEEAFLLELFGSTQGRPAPLARRVASQAAQAFHAEACAWLGSTPQPSPAPELPAEASALGHWGAAFKLELFGDIQICVLWNASALKNQGWLECPAPSQPLQPWSPKEQFATASMRLQLVVGDTDIHLGDLSGLQVGDVLVLAQGIDSRLTLRSQDGEFERQVYLGQLQGRRAAQFTPLSTK